MEHKKVSERLYDYSAGIYCGVLMPEKVMKKLVKLNAKYKEEVRKILLDNQDVLYASNWTLASTQTEDGKIIKQITIRYIKENDKNELLRRIMGFKVAEPRYEPNVYIVKDYKEADIVAEQILAEEILTEDRIGGINDN